MNDTTCIPEDDWQRIVQHVPIVAVDLVVRHDDGIVLGKRENAPAKGEWFVPGGRVHKHESLKDAVTRVATEELGITVEIERRLGVYEHCWDTTELADVASKHYVPIGFHVASTDNESLQADAQHTAVKTFTPPIDATDLHPYVIAYLDDAGVDLDTESAPNN